MHTIHTHRVLSISALLAIAGCAAGSSGAPLSGSSSMPLARFVHAGTPLASFSGSHTRMPLRSVRPNYAAKGSLVFEGDQQEAAVNIYQTADLSKNPSPIATIHVETGCPYGLAMDKKGTLYVADNCAVGDVEEYPKGSTTEKVAITDGISYPLGLAMDKKGTLYVSNYPAAITEYAFGTTTPSQTITGQGLKNPFGLALDKSGNLYIADFGASAVFEVKYGTTTVTNLGLEDCDSPTGAAVDQKNGYLWVTCESGNTINVYEPGQTSPTEQITGQGSPYAISIENKGKPRGTVVESDLKTDEVYAYKKGQYTSYATLTNGIELPTGLLITKP
jgi:DNA-binding beta-propeller fold protein YncE